MASKLVSSCLKNCVNPNITLNLLKSNRCLVHILMHSHYMIWYGRMNFIESKSAVAIELEILELKPTDLRTAQLFT